MEIELNEDTIGGYDWLNICSITRLMDFGYIIVFNDLKVVLCQANTGDTFAIVGD